MMYVKYIKCIKHIYDFDTMMYVKYIKCIPNYNEIYSVE